MAGNRKMREKDSEEWIINKPRPRERQLGYCYLLASGNTEACLRPRHLNGSPLGQSCAEGFKQEGFRIQTRFPASKYDVFSV